MTHIYCPQCGKAHGPRVDGSEFCIGCHEIGETPQYDYAAIQAELDALNAGIKSKAQFTEEMDFAIKHAYTTGRSRDELALWFKKRYGWGCRDTLNKRAKELGVA